MSTLSVIAFFVAAPFAFSTSPDNVRQSLTSGDFTAAYLEAEALGTADGYALAAESLLSEILIGLAEKNKKQAKRARKLAAAAMEMEPDNQNAHLQYAIADGFVARETGDVSAWMKKLPQKTLAIIETYCADYPDDPRGKVLLGAWHLAIVRKAGNKNAQDWFGANLADGRALFDIAQAQQPQDIIIGVNYAFALLALDDEDFPNTQDVIPILNEVIAAEPADHIGQILKTYAELALTRIDDRDDVRDYAEMFLDGKVPAFPTEN